MKRKTYILVISAANSVKQRARSGFKFTKDPRAVMVTLDRKLALEADSDLKVYKPKSDHYRRATGKEEMPKSIENKMDAGLLKLHSTVIADSDYQRSEDSIRNELDMMGEEGMEQVAKELKIKVGKEENLQDVLTSTLLQLEAEPLEVDPADELPEEKEDEEEEEDTDEDEDEEEETDEDDAKVLDRFDELDAMTPEQLGAELEKAGFENEGEKAGKILALLVEEFGEGVEDMELPEVTAEGEEGEEGSEDDDTEGTEEGADGAQDAPEEPKAPKTPAAKKNAPAAKKKAVKKPKAKAAKKK